MIYLLCALVVKMGANWRRSGRRPELYREEREEREKEEASRKRKVTTGLALSRPFGLGLAENGPFRSRPGRSYYFRPNPNRRDLFGPTEVHFGLQLDEKSFSAKFWPKTTTSATTRPTGY